MGGCNLLYLRRILFVIIMLLFFSPVAQAGEQVHVNAFCVGDSVGDEVYLNDLTTLTFGWARINADLDLFRDEFPGQAEELAELADQSQVKKLLGVFCNDSSIIKNLINEETGEFVIKLNNFLEEQPITYDGIVIDFENFPKEEREQFVIWLSAVKEDLEVKGKLLSVCLPPPVYNSKFFDYSGIAAIVDEIILMAHDYEDPAMASSEKPNKPFNLIWEDLSVLSDVYNVPGYKVLLQLSLENDQWKQDSYGQYIWLCDDSEDGIRKSPYNPILEQIQSVLSSNNVDIVKDELNSKTKTKELVFWRDENFDQEDDFYCIEDKENQNSCIPVTGTHTILNTIYYDDEESLPDKVNLIEEFNLKGLSVWKLGFRGKPHPREWGVFREEAPSYKWPDLNVDNMIDLEDIAVLANEYGKNEKASKWGADAERADVYNNGHIDLFDLVKLSRSVR